MKSRFALIATALVSLSACVPAAPAPSKSGSATPMPTPAPRPQPVPQPAQPVYQTDWTYWPVTPGDWVYRRDERGSIALFGAMGQDALVSLRCDAGRRMIYLSRVGQVSGNAEMTVRASQGLQAFSAAQVTGAPYIVASIQPNDPILDKLAYSRGRFVVEVTGQTPLKLPNWAEVSRVIEDCRLRPPERAQGVQS